MDTQQFEQRLRKMTPVAAPAEEHEAVVSFSRLLEQLTHTPATHQCRLVGPNGEGIAVPESVFYVLERVAELLARGDAISVVPVAKELTTQKAAELLNVSRQYLVRLLSEGKIPFTHSGKHRRLKFKDVVAFKNKRDNERHEKLRALTRMSEEFGGYEREAK